MIWGELDNVPDRRAQSLRHLGGDEAYSAPRGVPLLDAAQFPRVGAEGIRQSPVPAHRRALCRLFPLEDSGPVPHHRGFSQAAQDRDEGHHRGDTRGDWRRRRRRTAASGTSWRRWSSAWRASPPTRRTCRSRPARRRMPKHDPARKAELLRLAEICAQGPGESLRDPGRGGERRVDRLGGPAHGEHQRRPLPRAGWTSGSSPISRRTWRSSTRTEERDGVHQERHRAGRLLLHALHRPPAPRPGHRQLPLRRQLVRPGHHPGRRHPGRRGRGQRHDLHLPEGHRDAQHPRPQRERALQHRERTARPI